MTEPKRVTGDDFDFDSAPLFRKIATLPVDNVVFAEGGEEIATYQTDANTGERYVETTKTAQAGDAIVTRDEDDVYIIDADKFKKLYEKDPENPDQYRSTNTGRAVLMEEDIVIHASWGEDQNIKAGGVLFRSEAADSVYGNQKHSFEGDFGRVGADGSVMPLTAPLAEQKEWAKETGEVSHLRDINRRIEIEEAAGPKQVSVAPPTGGTAPS